MIFEVECDTTKNELTDRTEHAMIAPFIVLDIQSLYSAKNRQRMLSPVNWC